MNALKSIRLNSDMTQAAFAKALGINQGYLSRLERDTSRMSLELAAKIISRCDGQVTVTVALDGTFGLFARDAKLKRRYLK